MLTLASLDTPFVSTSTNGLPLNAVSDDKRAKYLFLDTDLLLSVLYLDGKTSIKLT